MGGTRLLVDVPRMLWMLRMNDAKLEGREWWAPCPNPKHQEKEPSWSIQDDSASERHGNHYCFGCEWGGGPVALVAKRLGMSPWGSKNWLINNGLLLGKGSAVQDVVVNVMSPTRPSPALPGGVVVGPIERWPLMAAEYAVEQRGITPEQIDAFRLGYATQGRLKGRIVFPAYDQYGRITNYTARSFVGANRRYLNPDRKDGFPDYLSIFGEHLWGEDRKIVVVAEGAVKVLAYHRLRNCAVGGLFGSHIKPGQILKLSRFELVVVLEDPDIKGREYAEALKASLMTATRVAVAHMPDRKQSDEQEPNALLEAVDEALCYE